MAWKSSKCPRESLASFGSHGAEVQAVTVGEDVVFLARAMWLEIRGGIVNRSSWESEVSTKTVSGLVTDSKGIYDLTATGQQAMKLLTQLRWVNGVAQLADAVTKSAPSAKKGILEFFRRGQARSVVHARPVRRSARRGS